MRMYAKWIQSTVERHIIIDMQRAACSVSMYWHHYPSIRHALMWSPEASISSATGKSPAYFGKASHLLREGGKASSQGSKHGTAIGHFTLCLMTLKASPYNSRGFGTNLRFMLIRLKLHPEGMPQKHARWCHKIVILTFQKKSENILSPM